MKNPFLAQLQQWGPPVSLTGLIASFLTTLWIIFSAIAVVCFLMAGVIFLTAQGDSNKLKLARYAVLGGVAGVAIGILSYVIIPLVGSLFGV